ncbi:MAG: hypothetical protein E7348_04715 [Clostridiales bacterium]|nr:hypothetical protein [Clostridiales bacterium]
MNLLLQDILTSYSLPTIIIAIIVCSASLTLNKFFNRLPKTIKVYIPFLMAIVLYFLYDMIFVINDFTFRSETLYAGIFSGSISAIINSTITKLLQGKPINTNTTILLIEDILRGYIDQKVLSKTASEIENLLLFNTDDDLTQKNIVALLTEITSELSQMDICNLAKLIIVAVSSIKKQ